MAKRKRASGSAASASGHSASGNPQLSASPKTAACRNRHKTAACRKRRLSALDECATAATDAGYDELHETCVSAAAKYRKKQAGNTKRKKKELRDLRENGITGPRRDQLEQEFAEIASASAIPVTKSQFDCPTTGLVMGICGCEKCVMEDDI